MSADPSAAMHTSAPSSSLDLLTARHQAILERLVLDGATPRDVSQEFGITESRLSVIRSSSLWKKAESELRRKALEGHIVQIESLRGKAITALADTVTDVDPRVRLQSAREILNRSGLSETTRLEASLEKEIRLYVPKFWNNPGQDLIEEEEEESD